MTINRYFMFAAVVVALLLTTPAISALADEVQSSQEPIGQVFYLGETVNTGVDTGYSEQNPIAEGDLHFDWDLGQFFISGFTSKSKGGDSPVFLKNVGDDVKLWFKLQQDIDCIGGDSNLRIAEDGNGSDAYFGVPKSNFGRGMLIIRHTDYQNNSKDPVKYADYLSGVKAGANTEVRVLEEGDYEVALDYEVIRSKFAPFGFEVLPDYANYRVFFKFSIRNGNAMVYPRDVETNAELTNSSSTANGFYIDFAKSRYLNVYIQKANLSESADGLVEDTRFNRPAKDGEKYTEEGLYTITATNPETNMTTEKRIYVGDNDVMKAAAATGLSIAEIQSQISKGAVVSDDGQLVQAAGVPSAEANGDLSEPSPETDAKDTNTEAAESSAGLPLSGIVIPAAVGLLAVVALVTVVALARRRKNAAAPALDGSQVGGDESGETE